MKQWKITYTRDPPHLVSEQVAGPADLLRERAAQHAGRRKGRGPRTRPVAACSGGSGARYGGRLRRRGRLLLGLQRRRRRCGGRLASGRAGSPRGNRRRRHRGRLLRLLLLLHVRFNRARSRRRRARLSQRSSVTSSAAATASSGVSARPLGANACLEFVPHLPPKAGHSAHHLITESMSHLASVHFFREKKMVRGRPDGLKDGPSAGGPPGGRRGAHASWTAASPRGSSRR